VLARILKNLVAGAEPEPAGAAPLRLNLGCGTKKREGYLNVDKIAGCSPDVVLDLERVPWPWPDNSVEEVVLIHVLEHIGRDSDTYLSVMKELYRVCRHDARIHVVVPHPRHDHFLGDPTHVRAIIPGSLALFDQRLNRQWQEQGAANTPLGLYLGVDFELTFLEYEFDEPWKGQIERKEISFNEALVAEARYNNVVTEIRMALRVRKS
jgi:hypothetical protein